MADEEATIKLDVSLHGENSFTRLRREFAKTRAAQAAFNTGADENSTSMSRMERHVKRLDDQHGKLNKTLNKQNRILRMGLMPGLKMITSGFSALRFAIIPAAVALAGFLAATGGAKLVLGAANLATKAWTYSLKALAAGVAVALGAISMFAAALSELKAVAALPFTGIGAGGSNQAVQGLWGSIMGDPKTAALGVDAIQSTSLALLKMKVPLADVTKYIKQLGDYGFYAGGGDAGAGLTGIIEAMKGLGTGKLKAESLTAFAAAFGDMAPNIEEVGKKFVGKDVQSFVDFLLSDPKQLAAFNDGLDQLNATMIGTIKTFRPMAQGVITPFGEMLNKVAVGPITSFRDRMLDILRSVMPAVVLFLGTRMPGILERLSGFLERMRDKFLKVLASIGEEGSGKGKITGFFDSIKNGWEKAKGPLKSLAAGWDAVWGGLKPIVSALGGMLGRFLMGGAEGATTGADGLRLAGESIAKVFAAGGPVETFLKLTVDVLKTLGTAFGPALLAAWEALKSPALIFQKLIDHEDDLAKIGGSIERAFHSLGPVFEAIGSVIDAILDALPDVAAVLAIITTTAAGLVHAFQPVLDVILAVAKQFKIIQGVILFMISRAVLTGVTRLAEKIVGSGGGNINTGLLAAKATMFGIGAGTAFNGYRSGGVGGVAQMAGGGALMGAQVGGPLGAVVGGLAGLTIGAISSAIRTDWAKTNTMTADQRSELNGITSNVDMTSNSGLLGTWRSANDQYNRMGSRYQNNSGFKTELDKQQGLVYGAGTQLEKNLKGLFTTNANGSVTSLFGKSSSAGPVAPTGAITAQQMIDFNERSAAHSQVIDSFYKDEMPRIAALADRAGVDLSDGAMSLAEGTKMIEQAASELKPIGQIISESFDKYIFKPIADRRYQDGLATAGQDIMDALAGTQFDQTVAEDFGTSIIQHAMSEIEAAITSGTDPSGAVQKGVDELTRLRDDLTGRAYLYSLDGQTENATKAQASADVITGLIDDYATAADAAVTTAATQKAEFDTLVAGMASTFGTSMGSVLAGLSDGATNLYNQMMALSGIQITVTPSGSLYVTSGSVNGTPGSPTSSGNPHGDTSSPRSHLLNTQRVHNMVNGGVSGRRTITSMHRNWNLGSGNSDHVTGRALDVVGDNLVSYASAMRGMGGFAEFHGSGAGRHLHVVPPTLPVGDRPVPRPPKNFAHQPQISQTFATTVNSAPHMNEEMLARKTARRVASMQRELVERT